MTAQEPKQLTDLVQEARTGDEKPVIGSLNSVEHRCSSCGGVVMTVVFGGTDGPKIRLRPGSKGRRPMRLNDDGDCKPAHTSLRHEVCGAGQGTVFGRPKITIICGGCGASLIRFEGRAYD